MGRAGDAMAALFVPPDQALGWPRGVQEGDEPWGWRGSVSAGPAPHPARNDSSDQGGGGGVPDETREGRDPRSGSFVVPVDRVAPVRIGVRPH